MFNIDINVPKDEPIVGVRTTDKRGFDPDELAEQMLQDADEIERIAYAANGERIPYDLKES